jgi:hypothetical protein
VQNLPDGQYVVVRFKAAGRGAIESADALLQQLLYGFISRASPVIAARREQRSELLPTNGILRQVQRSTLHAIVSSAYRSRSIKKQGGSHDHFEVPVLGICVILCLCSVGSANAKTYCAHYIGGPERIDPNAPRSQCVFATLAECRASVRKGAVELATEKEAGPESFSGTARASVLRVDGAPSHRRRIQRRRRITASRTKISAAVSPSQYWSRGARYLELREAGSGDNARRGRRNPL